MQCGAQFNRFEETVPNYIAEHHKPSYNHPNDGHGPTSTQKKRRKKENPERCTRNMQRGESKQQGK